MNKKENYCRVNSKFVNMVFVSVSDTEPDPDSEIFWIRIRRSKMLNHHDIFFTSHNISVYSIFQLTFFDEKILQVWNN